MPIFKYEDNILKHHVRLEAWLPACRRRLRQIRADAQRMGRTSRRLRYFTFCAVGATDVLLLEVERILRPSTAGNFDTVVFFDRNLESVVETRKRIPGSIGFAGNFTAVVLQEDPDAEEEAVEALDARPDQEDVKDVRAGQRRLAERRAFIGRFPFDVVNLDLEEFLFKPNDPLPGRVINAIRKVLEWQKRPFVVGRTRWQMEAFSLFFTTQIGPPNLSDNYIRMLEGSIERNFLEDQDLVDLCEEVTGERDIHLIRQASFDAFFKLSMPKVLTRLILEGDWYVEAIPGVSILEFERPSSSGPYRILHLVMDVRRQQPPLQRRAPGEFAAEAMEAYRSVVRKIFSNPVVVVSSEIIDEEKLSRSLDQVRARQRLHLAG